MNTNYSQISYIAMVDTNVSTAASSVDYRSDLVTEVSQKMRDAIRTFLALDQSSRFVSPSVNVHKILDARNQEEYRNFFRAIDRYRVCVAGWNSEHSVPPSPSQIESAAMGTVRLMLNGAPAPNAMLLDDGTIGAYWRSGHKYASIDFETDGEHPWAGTDGQNFWSGIWNTSSELPEALLSKLEFDPR